MSFLRNDTVLSSPEFQCRGPQAVAGVSVVGYHTTPAATPQPSAPPPPHAFFDPASKLRAEHARAVAQRTVAPRGLRVAADGRLRAGGGAGAGVGGGGSAGGGPARTVASPHGVSADDMAPARRCGPETGAAASARSLARYSVTGANRDAEACLEDIVQDPDLDDDEVAAALAGNLRRRAGDREATLSRVVGGWARAHLDGAGPRLPAACLASPPLRSDGGAEAAAAAARQPASMPAKAIRVVVDSPAGLSHTIELPNGVDTTVSALLAETLRREETVRRRHRFAPESGPLFAPGAELAARSDDVRLRFRGADAHPFDTVGEVGGHHMCRFSLFLRGEMRVEPSPPPPPRDAAAARSGGERRILREQARSSAEQLSRFVGTPEEYVTQSVGGGEEAERAAAAAARTAAEARALAEMRAPGGVATQGGAAVATAATTARWAAEVADKGWRRAGAGGGAGGGGGAALGETLSAPAAAAGAAGGGGGAGGGFLGAGGGGQQKPAAAAAAAVDDLGEFQIGTPVDRRFDDKTGRVVLMDRDGRKAAAFGGSDGGGDLVQTVVPISGHPMRSFLILFYEERGESGPLKDVDKIMYNFQDQEDLIADILVEKYGKGSRQGAAGDDKGNGDDIRQIYSDYAAQIRDSRDEAWVAPPSVEEFLDVQTGCTVHYDGEGCYYLDDPAEPGKTYELSQHPVRQYFIDYLNEKDPSLVAEVDALMWEYQYEEALLYKDLVEKYGAPPQDLHPYETYAAYHRKEARKRRREEGYSVVGTSIAETASSSFAGAAGAGSFNKNHHHHPASLEKKALPLREKGEWAEVRGRGAASSPYFVNNRTGRVTYDQEATAFSATGVPMEDTLTSLQTQNTDFSHYTDLSNNGAAGGAADAASSRGSSVATASTAAAPVSATAPGTGTAPMVFRPGGAAAQASSVQNRPPPPPPPADVDASSVADDADLPPLPSSPPPVKKGGGGGGKTSKKNPGGAAKGGKASGSKRAEAAAAAADAAVAARRAPNPSVL